MPRPRKPRCVSRHPKAVYYKPQGIPMRRLQHAVLPVEGFEAMRLADAKGLAHEAAARIMEVSRPTFSRILTQARKTVAEAVSNGWAIRIEGGTYRISENDGELPIVETNPV